MMEGQMLGAWMCAIAGVMGLPPMRVAINIPAYRLDVYVAIDLARLVHRFGSPSLSADDVARLAADTATTRVLNLDHAVPLEVRYDLVEIRGGRLTVYRDVYRLASQSLLDAVYSALTAYGVDATSIDPARIRALVREVPSAGREVPVDSLLRGSDRPTHGTTSTGHAAP